MQIFTFHKISINFLNFINIKSFSGIHKNLMKQKVNKHRTNLEREAKLEKWIRSLKLSFKILTGKNQRKLGLYTYITTLGTYILPCDCIALYFQGRSFPV